MTTDTIDCRMVEFEKRLAAHEKRTEEFMNRILFQQERIDQVINVHSNLLESMSTTQEIFFTKEITLRDWFMKQVDENRKFSSSIIIKLVAIFTALVMGIFGLSKIFGGL